MIKTDKRKVITSKRPWVSVPHSMCLDESCWILVAGGVLTASIKVWIFCETSWSIYDASREISSVLDTNGNTIQALIEICSVDGPTISVKSQSETWRNNKKISKTVASSFSNDPWWKLSCYSSSQTQKSTFWTEEYRLPASRKGRNTQKCSCYNVNPLQQVSKMTPKIETSSICCFLGRPVTARRPVTALMWHPWCRNMGLIFLRRPRTARRHRTAPNNSDVAPPLTEHPDADPKIRFRF